MYENQLTERELRDIEEEADLSVMSWYFLNGAQQLRDYRRANRVYREGPKSLNSAVTPAEDIYSLLFASSFSKDLYDSIQW